MADGHPVFAALYDRFMRQAEKRVGRHREWIVGGARGRVLEVGAGTGASFPCYRKADEVVALEPDPFMRAKAEARLRDLRDAAPISLRPGPVEALPFKDASFDTAVSTLVFCSVASPRKGLSELSRVLRPGGEFRFIEHVRGDGPGAAVRDALTPLWKRISAGCHLNRRTVEEMRRAGFQVGEVRRDALPPGVPLVAGVARKP
ncbi:MAG: class I SAM-dependent methyltransferase [Halobacteria archaeon]